MTGTPSEVVVEQTSRGWTVYLCTGTTRARIATYSARYRAIEHARHLAGTDTTDDD